MDFLFVLLATFWVWETLRFAMEEYLPVVAQVTRALHPVILALFPLYVLWPDWILALAVAGGAGLLVAVADRLFARPAAPVVMPAPRRDRGTLPPLP